MKKLIYIIFIVLFSYQAHAKNPPPGVGTNIPANILIMLDTSGSMSIAMYQSVPIYLPVDVAVDSSGNVYALEYSYQRIRVFDSNGKFLRDFGGYGYGGRSCNRWGYARQIDIYNDQIYIADYYGKKINVVDLYGNCIKRNNTDNSGWAYPSGIAVGSNYTYVSYEDSNGRISIHNTSNLSHVKSYNNTSHLFYTRGIDLNSSEDSLIAANMYTYRGQPPIAQFNVSGSNITYSKSIGTASWGRGNGTFTYTFDAVFDGNDNIYATDYYGHRIQKFNSSGTYQAQYGSYAPWGSTDPFKYPQGLGVDSSNNIYVADYGQNAVRKLDSSLNLTTTFGAGGANRLDVAKKVIKKIVSDSSLTSGANFGLMEWGSSSEVTANVDNNGAKNIINRLNQIPYRGGTNLVGAMNLARNHFTQGKVANWNLDCSQNYLIVISDGYWGSNSSVTSIANQLKNSHNIKTFAVGWALGTGNSNYTSLATAGGTKTPLYADNEAQLLAKLTTAIKQAVSGRVTFNTPAIIPGVTWLERIYQSTFTYKANGQWEGYLKKYYVNQKDGSVGTELWDAAEKLNKKKASDRKIWTIGLNVKSTNNFTTAYRSELRGLLFDSNPSDSEVDDLINFVRGTDTYDEDADNNKTESRHKLADIYHADLTFVGSVGGATGNLTTHATSRSGKWVEMSGRSNYKLTDSSYRKENGWDNYRAYQCGRARCSYANGYEVLYAGANSGILHAFNNRDNGPNAGEEIWGYIPPNIIGKLSNIISNQANETNSIYGIDGSPVVKDIYYDDTPNDNNDNPKWKTILLSGLGAGGHGYFALDVSNPTNPKHLFAIQNDPSNQIVKHWDSNEIPHEYGYASGNIIPEFDYRKLGESWSTPRIIRIKINGKDRWVAVFGGGYNSGVNHNYGSAVFVMDLENEGKLLKKIDIDDIENNTLTKTYTGDGSTTRYTIPFSYNNSSHNLRVFLNNVDATGITVSGSYLTFNAAPNKDDKIVIKRLDKKDIVNSVPSDLAVITADGTTKANYSGAMVYVADLEGKITKINLTDQGTLYDKTILFDAESDTENGRYVYHAPSPTIGSDNNLWLYFGTGDKQRYEDKSSKILNRVYGIKDKDFPSFKKINKIGTISECKTAPNCPDPSDLGWYINLKNSQKLTAGVAIDNDQVYFPIYEPSASSTKCSLGLAIIGGAEAECGKGNYTTVGTGVLSKIVVIQQKGVVTTCGNPCVTKVVNTHNIYMGISGEAKSGTGFNSKGNLLWKKSTATERKAVGGKIQMEGWKENY